MAKPTLTLPAAANARPVAVSEPAPYLSACVIVKTAENIAGQNEHAAIVTKLLGGDIVNVLLLPGDGQPYPVLSIKRATGSPSWRWPQR